MLKQTPVVCLALLALAGGASAAAMPCATGTLADYTNLAMGCTVDDTLFAEFSAQGSFFGTPIDPAAIQVTPVSGLNRRGFQFELDASAGPFDAMSVLIGYTVSWAMGGSVELGGSMVTPDGVNTAILNICSGDYDPSGPFACTGSENFAIAFDDGVSAQLLASTMAPAGFFDVFVDIVIDGGLSGSSSLDSVTVLHTVPEPGTLSLVLGTLAVAALRRMRRP